MSTSIVLFERVAKQYEERTILHDFNLEIREGELLTIIGASGSGKTTVLKMINGLIVPDAGRVLVEGHDVARMPEPERVGLRRRIGYAIQGTGLFPHMNVADNMGYVLRLQGIDKSTIRKRIQELCAIVDLSSDVLSRHPRELSGGQQQRVGLARALAASPRIMLMDEPFGAVDAITRSHLQGELARIHTDLGMSVVFVTHDVDEALKLGNRVLVMSEGVIEQLAEPDVLLAQPRGPFVTELLGERLATFHTGPNTL